MCHVWEPHGSRYQPTSGWEIAGRVSGEDRDFELDSRTDDYLNIDVSVSRRLTRLFWITAEYQYADRNSTESGEEYKESRYSLLFVLRSSR